MDRGIPTEETLEQMRTAQPPVHYLVGTPKGRLSKFERKFLNLPWQAVRPSVDVKLLAHDEELYILARSHPRTFKERSMRRRRLKILWRRLHELQQQTPTRDALLLKLGAAKKEAGRAYHLVEIQIPDPNQQTRHWTCPDCAHRCATAPPRLTSKRPGPPPSCRARFAVDSKSHQIDRRMSALEPTTTTPILPEQRRSAGCFSYPSPASGTEKQPGIVHCSPWRGGLDDPQSPGNTALGAVRKCGSGRSLGRDRQVSTVRGCVGPLADSDLTPTHQRRHRRYARRAPPLAGSIGSGGKQRHVPGGRGGTIQRGFASTGTVSSRGLFAK